MRDRALRILGFNRRRSRAKVNHPERIVECRWTNATSPKKIEPYWQAEWDRADLYLTREDRDRPKFYVLEMFPYPSGDGLSVGHLHNYVPCDVIGRYKRMAGYNVLHAMGWDAFGLPAENDALLKGLHPKETVPRYAANFKRQLKLVRMRLRLDARNQFVHARILPVDAVVLPAAAQARARLPRDGLAMVVRQMPHRSWPTSR